MEQADNEFKQKQIEDLQHQISLIQEERDKDFRYQELLHENEERKKKLKTVEKELSDIQ